MNICTYKYTEKENGVITPAVIRWWRFLTSETTHPLDVLLTEFLLIDKYAEVKVD